MLITLSPKDFKMDISIFEFELIIILMSLVEVFRILELTFNTFYRKSTIMDIIMILALMT